MPRRLVLAALLLLAAAPLARADVSPAARAMPIPRLDAGPPVALLPADDLLGRAVLDWGGGFAGRLSHLLIDPADGRLRFALLRDVPGLVPGGDVVVPWRLLRLGGPGEDVRLAAPLAELGHLPRLHGPLDALHPDITAQILDFDPGDRPLDPTLSRSPPPPRGEIALPEGPPGAEATAGPPILVPADAMHNVPVATQEGRPIGTLGEVMIDPASARAAFALVAIGGPGRPRAWLPVPLPVLVAGATRYELAAADFWVRQVPPLLRPEPPRAVGAVWLTALYDTYGLKPYRRAE